MSPQSKSLDPQRLIESLPDLDGVQAVGGPGPLEGLPFTLSWSNKFRVAAPPHFHRLRDFSRDDIAVDSEIGKVVLERPLITRVDFDGTITGNAIATHLVRDRPPAGAKVQRTFVTCGGVEEVDAAGVARDSSAQERSSRHDLCRSSNSTLGSGQRAATELEVLLNYLGPALTQPVVVTSKLSEQFVCQLVDEALLWLDSAPFQQLHTPLLGAVPGIDEVLFRDCARTDLAALGARCAARIAVAHATLAPPFDSPTFRLLQQACRVSLRPRDRRQRNKLTTELQKAHDPVWAALARRIARTASSDDTRFLMSIARGEVMWSDPCAAYLGSVVRGDISFNGEVIPFETICADAQVKPPPVLEPLTLDEEDAESEDSAPEDWTSSQ